jgi:four helix bundle protein
MNDTRAPIESHRDLIVWRKSMDVAVAAYRLTDTFPVHERYGSTSQIRRSSASIHRRRGRAHSHRVLGNAEEIGKMLRSPIRVIER